jgi:hypothetical protein
MNCKKLPEEGSMARILGLFLVFISIAGSADTGSLWVCDAECGAVSAQGGYAKMTPIQGAGRTAREAFQMLLLSCSPENGPMGMVPKGLSPRTHFYRITLDSNGAPELIVHRFCHQEQ